MYIFLQMSINVYQLFGQTVHICVSADWFRVWVVC